MTQQHSQGGGGAVVDPRRLAAARATARALGVSPTTVRALVKRGDLPPPVHLPDLSPWPLYDQDAVARLRVLQAIEHTADAGRTAGEIAATSLLSRWRIEQAIRDLRAAGLIEPADQPAGQAVAWRPTRT